MRLLSPDGACRQVDVVTASGRKRRYGSFGEAGGGVVEASGADARTLQQAGWTPASTAGPARTRGFACPGCGFRSYFLTCGRCGALCEREDHQ